MPLIIVEPSPFASVPFEAKGSADGSPTPYLTHTVRLDDRVDIVSSFHDLLGASRDVRLLVHEGGDQKLEPMTWIGSERSTEYHTRTRRYPDVMLYAIRDVALLGRTALLKGREYLTFDHYHFTETARFDPYENPRLLTAREGERVEFALPSDRMRIDEDCVVLTQGGDRCWGHWIVDMLPRIALMRRLLPDAVYVLPEVGAWAKELLQHTRLMPQQVRFYDPQTTLLQARRMFMPSFVRWGNAFSPAVGDIFRELPTPIRARRRKLFVTRRYLPEGATLLNHPEIERLFEARGFDVVRPETMSIEAQLAMFSQASHVAGEYGSGLHGTVFSAPGTRVLVVQSESVQQYVQAGLGVVMGQPTGFVWGKADMPDASYAPRVAPWFQGRYFRLDPVIAAQGLDELLDA